MAFYENTIVTKQDLAEKELQKVREKYSKLINESAGKVIKIEDWGLLNLSNKIKNYRKGFYIHYKFQGNKSTLDEIDKNIKVDGSILRHLTVWCRLNHRQFFSFLCKFQFLDQNNL